ncbi:DUF3164 family protein [Shinella sp.]|uniref:DUF3164 family protein n=1 Tax=Shinella sp. TaxID=1870904 RepID=UPI00258E9F1E|nr:DUF3164 family protein [Shinella sp.]MCW5711292.1 DUF3164 family protein [Shinella sp.]
MKFSISPTIPTEDIGGTLYVRKPKGELVLYSSLKPEHVEEDELVRRLAGKAAAVNALLASLREETLAEVTALRALLAEKYGVKRRGKKGNITLVTVDGSTRLNISIGETLTFGPELEVAKELIDECIRRWSEGSNNNIRALVDQAFQVDKNKGLNVDRILGLRRLKIVDDTGDWEKAMNIIGDSVRTLASKEYARFYVVDKETEEATPIKLDLANV